MANRKSEFGAGSLRPDTGILKPAVERPALQSKGPGAQNQPSPVQPKVLDPNKMNIISDPKPIAEEELATSRRRYVLGGGTVGDTKIARHITTPTDRNANSKEVLQKLNEHYNVLNSFATTHSGAVQTAARALPNAHRDHGKATMGLMSASENLALARTSFAEKNAPRGNEHLQKAARNLVSAHGMLNSANVREVTGSEVPIHKDELSSWQSHASNLRVFRRQGKPFDRVQIGKATLPSNSPAASETEQATKGTILGDKIKRARTGTPRTPSWERSLPSMPEKSEKGTGVINTATKGTAAGTTGQNDPRRKASSTNRINVTLPKANLPKIGDASRPAKKPMKPGDTVEGK